MSNASKAKLGIRCKVYVNTASDATKYSVPTWVEIKCVNDWKENVGWQKADGNDRQSRVNQSAKTSLDLSWSGNIKRGGTAYDTIHDALLTDEYLDVLILDGPYSTVGSKGYRCDVQVFNGNNDQGRNTTLYDEIELMPTIGDHTPKAAKIITGGVLNVADITGDALSFAAAADPS